MDLFSWIERALPFSFDEDGIVATWTADVPAVAVLPVLFALLVVYLSRT
jgi:hypothetical protein